MAVNGFDELLEHLGHDIEVAAYAVNVTVECVECGEVLFEFDKPELGRSSKYRDALDGRGCLRTHRQKGDACRELWPTDKTQWCRGCVQLGPIDPKKA